MTTVFGSRGWSLYTGLTVLTKISTTSIRDLNYLNLKRWFDFRLEPIFDTAPAASKINTYFKSDPKGQD